MTEGLNRAWLDPVHEPDYIDEDDGYYSNDDTYEWADDLDNALERLRQEDKVLDAAFTLAAAGGIAVLVVCDRQNDIVSPLEALSRNGGDEDWIILSSKDRDDFYASIVAERLGGCRVETHTSPRWTFRIACHA